MAYTQEVLSEILKEGGAVVLEDYQRYNQRLRVAFRCFCGIETSKRFEMLKMYRLPYCENCSKKHMVERQRKTCMEKYGVDNGMKLKCNKEKQQAVYDEKYGGHPKKTKEVQEKWKQTCLEKYGGHPNQNREVQAKSEFKGCHYKEYTFPSGKVVKVQGYENLALDKLLTEGVKEDDIVVGKAEVPSIEYHTGDTNRVYFPDIYIPSEHKLIEVKSEWTLKLPTHVEEKAEASVAAGYAYEIWVFNSNRKFIHRKVFGFDGEKVTLPA